MAGGAIVWVADRAVFLSERSHSARTTEFAQIESLNDQLRRDYDRIQLRADEERSRRYDAEDRVLRLTEEVLNLRLAANEQGIPPVDIVRRYIQAHPGIVWCKTRIVSGDFVTLEVSPQYADLFLDGPPIIYRGRKDSDIWPPDVAAQFAANDEEVWREGAGRYREPTRGGPEQVQGMFVSYKFRITDIPGMQLVCGGGEWLPGAAE